MFVGAINYKVRKYLETYKDVFRGEKVCVGCSGNFTFERILSGVADYIWSNDISLYSSLIGYQLTGREMELRVREKKYDWISKYLTDGIGKIAAISLLFEMLKFEKQDNLYKQRMYSYYRKHFDNLFKQSVERIRSALQDIQIHRYTTVDVYDLYRSLPAEGWICVAFLPTYKGGYERMYARLEEIIDWPRAQYQVLDEARYEETIANMRRGRFLYLSDRDRGKDNLVAVIKTSTLRTVYLYSNVLDRRAYIRTKMAFKKERWAFLPDDYEITEDAKIIMKQTDNATINYYRNLFLKKGIDYTSGTFCFLFFLDGFLFGFAIFSEMQRELAGVDRETAVYVLSDFVIDSKIERLSKLLLLVLRSKEMQDILKAKFVKNVKHLVTTVFTDKPVSMKYRGVFRLAKRGNGFLQYVAESGSFNTSEAVKTWLRKYRRR